MKWPGAGIQWEMDETAYHAVEAYSNSFGVTMHQQTPLDASESRLHPPDSTDAADEGTALHLRALQPHLFEDRICGPLLRDGERVKKQKIADKAAWKQYEAENAGKILIPLDAIQRVHAMGKALYSHPVSCTLLTHEKARKEVSIFWICETTGIKCKARIDLLTMWGEYPVAGDVKTIAGFQPATPFAPRSSGGLSIDYLKSTAGARGYDMQSWNYLDGLNTLSPAQRRFMFLFVSKPPKSRPGMSPKVRVVEANAIMLYEGEQKTLKQRRIYAKAMESGEWPSWPVEIDLLGLKPWDQTSEDEEESDDE